MLQWAKDIFKLYSLYKEPNKWAGSFVLVCVLVSLSLRAIGWYVIVVFDGHIYLCSVSWKS